MSTETPTRATGGAEREPGAEHEPMAEHEPGERFDLLVPTDGPVAATLWLGLFYLVVDRLSAPAVTAIQRWSPAVAADSVTTWLAVVLWLMVGAVAVKLLARQVSANPRTFDSRAERLAYLDRERPTRTAYLFYAATVLVGGVLVAAGWPFVGGLLDDAFAMVLERQDDATFDAASAGLLAAFFVGFGILSRATDRLVLGAVRDWRYRSFRPAEAVAAADTRLAGGILVGIAVVLAGYWLALLGTGQVPAVRGDTLALGLLLVGQVGAAIALLAAGTALATDRPGSIRVVLVAAGVLAYAALDAAGYFLGQGDTVGVGLFLALAMLGLGVTRRVLAREGAASPHSDEPTPAAVTIAPPVAAAEEVPSDDD